ncbi:MAG: hypothetical protein HUU17_03765 [Chthonomonadales bacterium]|nr:hypothetical protein [Chthonomonadales bacterium]
MSTLVHTDHGDDRSSRQPRSTNRVRLPIWVLVLILVVFIGTAGVFIASLVRSPDDAEVDARLARVRSELARARRDRRRGDSMAGVADRIVGSSSGRRAQQEWLD